MDVPCPESNSTDLQKVSLACEEVLYRCDKLAQFHGGFVGRGGPGVLVGASTTKGTKPTGLTAQSGGGGDKSNLQEYFSALVVLRRIRRSNPSRRPLPKVCWPHANKIVWRVELFGPNHEIE